MDISQLSETGSSKVDYSTLHQAVVQRARENSSIMTQYVFGYKNAECHNVWHDFIDNNNHGLILSFRDSGKSENVSIGRVLWEIGNNSNIRIKLATESEKLATDILSRISETILDNKKYHEVFPHVKRSKRQRWTRTALTVDRETPHKDATLEASGILTAATGGRADLIIFDDIAGMRNTLAFPKYRPMVKEAFYSNWLNLLDGPGTRWYAIGTPWHIEDIITELRENPAIPKSRPFMVGPNFESPWPERFSSEYFKEKLAILGRKHFNRAYRLQPINDEEAWINIGSLESCKDWTIKSSEVACDPNLPKFTGVDLGHRSGMDSSPTVVFTVALTPNGKRIPCDIRISQDASPLDIARVIINVNDELNPAITMVENVGAQQMLIDLVKNLGPGTFNIEGYFTSSQKLDPALGVPSMLAEIEANKWIIPLGDGGSHDSACQCKMCRWIGELIDFPHGRIDTVMASWLSLQGLRKLKERANMRGGFAVWNYNVGGLSR
jgi:hypothetical protein